MNEVENQIVNQKDNTNFIGSTLFENDKGENNQVKHKNVEIRKDLRVEFSHHNRFKHPLLQGSEDRKYPFGSECIRFKFIIPNSRLTNLNSPNFSLTKPRHIFTFSIKSLTDMNFKLYALQKDIGYIGKDVGEK
jgi:hypothetical protein